MICEMEDDIYEETESPVHGISYKVSPNFVKQFTSATGISGEIFLSFEYSENENKNTYTRGVRLSLTNKKTSVFMSINVFLSIAQMISEYKLILSGQVLVQTYLMQSRVNGSGSRGNKTSSSSQNVTEEES